MPAPSHKKPPSFKDIISNSYFQGLVTLISLIVAIIGEKYVRILSIGVLLIILIAIRATVRVWVSNVWKRLTWRFALGVITGVFVGFFLASSIESAYKFGLSFFLPEVEVVEVVPADGETLPYLHSSIEVRFSETVRSGFRRYVDVEIYPDYPIETTWIYYEDFDDCCQKLYIQPAKYFANVDGPQFEPNKTYHVRISGPLLAEPVEFDFHTPSESISEN